MTSCNARRNTTARAIAGALVWLLLPWLPFGDPPPFGGIEHVYLLAVLVIAPPALALASALLRPTGGAARRYAFARAVQPVASFAVVVSFLLPHGAAAGVLVLPWLVLALLLASGALPAVFAVVRPHLASANLFAAHVFLPIGGVWLVLTRLGTGPAQLTGLQVFLAVVHFHFGGFALGVMIAATAHSLPPRLAPLHRAIAIAAIAALPTVAAGKLTGSAALALAGVATAIVAALLLAFVWLCVALRTARGPARRLLFVAASSAAVAMLIAGAFRLGEDLGAHWLGVERMVTTHGLLHALGFVLCGTLAHLRLTAAAAPTTSIGSRT